MKKLRVAIRAAFHLKVSVSSCNTDSGKNGNVSSAKKVEVMGQVGLGKSFDTEGDQSLIEGNGSSEETE